VHVSCLVRREIGLALIAIGLVLVMASSIQSAGREETSYGGVILIGPIPIIFGSSPEMAVASMVMAMALTAIYFTLFLRGRR
jgi:uncharacterized protein (TIGR00304 family)